MKNPMFSKVFARHVLSVLLVASTTLAVGNFAAAADENDQPAEGSHLQKSPNEISKCDSCRTRRIQYLGA